jgi:radical SAM superfamily enzyme YgiQ (UPF0313 family)
MKVLLISTYEMGRQPFGLASPAAWLRESGADVTCVDVSRQPLPDAAVRDAGLIAFYVPMHTATRLAIALLPAVREMNPSARVCFYGLYAAMNESYLRRLGVDFILGGEFEEPLAFLVANLSPQDDGGRLVSGHDFSRAVSGTKSVRLQPPGGSSLPGEGWFSGGRTFRSDNVGATSSGALAAETQSAAISLARQKFRVPDRSGLAPLASYARLLMPHGESRTVGYTEASRGCKHLCRHCPIVPVYNGVFRIIDRDVVLEDVRRQVAAGAQHITFGDPDFFNGIGHAIPLVEALHREFPPLTYDVTIKVEHLLKHQDALPILRDTGCLFVTSAVESVDDAVLEKLAKNHTRADFLRVIELFREIGLTLAPTFVAFTPWTTLESYCELLETIRVENLIENVPPIQLAIRLLIPAGSRLLDLQDVREMIEPFNEEKLVYPWRHANPRVDVLCERLQQLVHSGEKMKLPRARIFDHIEEAAYEAAGRGDTDAHGARSRTMPVLASRATIPYLNEPWYC